MPTNKPRINITFEEAEAVMLSRLAKKEQKSVARLSKELILESLARHEDQFLSTLAESRDNPQAKRVQHKDVWD